MIELILRFLPIDGMISKSISFQENQMLPIPKKMWITEEKWFGISRQFNVTLRGSFIPQDKLQKRGNLPSIREPSLDAEKFLSKIPFWLENDENSRKETKFEILEQKVEKKIQIYNEELDYFVPEDSYSEAYRLISKNGKITIYSWSKRGMFYGIMTLRQLIRKMNNQIYLPNCDVLDYPDFEIRGLVDDISRGQSPTVENYKKFIRFMSSLKLNVLVLYIEDMFKFKKYPQIGENRGALTRETIQEIENYALDYFMEIQPGFECFGHMDNILSLEDFRKYGEFPGAQCFDISSEETKQFVDDLLSEITQAFQSEAFHLICDESHDFNLGRSRKYIKKIGEAEALAEWYLFLVNTVKKYGKSYPTIAHDIIYKYPKTLELVKDDIPLIVYWNYSNKKKYPVISKLKERGFTIAGLPGVFDWSRHYPYFDYAAVNMICMAQDGKERGIIGHITTKWGDFFNENFRENIYYGLAIEAQVAWDAENADLEDIIRGYNRIFFGTTDSRVIEFMDILNKQNEVLPTFPNGIFNRFWMDPYCREIEPKEYEDARRFINESQGIITGIEQIKREDIITKNIDNLDFIQFAAKLSRHYGIKLLASEAAFHENAEFSTKLYKRLNDHHIIANNTKVSNSEGLDLHYEHLQVVFQWLLDDIQGLKKEYRELWLRQAKPEGLQFPEHRFEILHWHYSQSIRAINEQIVPKAHQLQSEWIWRSGRRWSYKWGNHEWYYFYKSFIPKKPLKSAQIQAIASTHLKLFLNGRKIDEVFSRFSLSHMPMAKAVQLYEITNYIQEKKLNIICVEGINWARGIGGINIILHLVYDDGEEENIISDGTWLYTDNRPKNWPFEEKSNLDDFEDFKHVRSFGRPPGGVNGPISAPVWEKGWKSEISFSFGLRNHIDTSIKSFIGDTTYKVLFWLVPIGAKLLGPEIAGFREEN